MSTVVLALLHEDLSDMGSRVRKAEQQLRPRDHLPYGIRPVVRKWPSPARRSDELAISD